MEKINSQTFTDEQLVQQINRLMTNTHNTILKTILKTKKKKATSIRTLP